MMDTRDHGDEILNRNHSGLAVLIEFHYFVKGIIY